MPNSVTSNRTLVAARKRGLKVSLESLFPSVAAVGGDGPEAA